MSEATRSLTARLAASSSGAVKAEGLSRLQTPPQTHTTQTQTHTWPACAAISPSALLRRSEVLALPGLPLGCSVMSDCQAEPAAQGRGGEGVGWGAQPRSSLQPVRPELCGVWSHGVQFIITRFPGQGHVAHVAASFYLGARQAKGNGAHAKDVLLLLPHF